MIRRALINLNLLKSKFDGQIFVYIDHEGNIVSEMTSTVKWLEVISVECYKKDSDEELFRKACATHPELDSDVIHIF